MPRTPTHTDVEFIRTPHLQGVELRRSCYRQSVFRTHTHPVWSVGFIESGSTTFTLSGRSYHASAGQLVVIGPGRAHACNPTEGDSISYVMFYLSREWLAPAEPGDAYPSFPSPVIADDALADQWARLYGRFAENPGAADESELASAIDALVTRHSMTGASPVSERERESIAVAKRILAERLTDRVTLEELARETNLSRSHLSRAFKAAEGLPLHTYHNQLRIDRAKDMLVEGTSPTQVAAAVGFSDQAHFSRVFREFTGATPRQYGTTCGPGC